MPRKSVGVKASFALSLLRLLALVTRALSWRIEHDLQCHALAFSQHGNGYFIASLEFSQGAVKVLKIADFALSELHDHVAALQPSRTSPAAKVSAAVGATGAIGQFP